MPGMLCCIPPHLIAEAGVAANNSASAPAGRIRCRMMASIFDGHTIPLPVSTNTHKREIDPVAATGCLASPESGRRRRKVFTLVHRDVPPFHDGTVFVAIK
jgi:hypothetical protein